MKSDIEIAQEAVPLPIMEVAASLGIPESAVLPYGRAKAKLDLKELRDRGAGTDGAGISGAGTGGAGTDGAGTDSAGTDSAGIDSAGIDSAGTDGADTDGAGTGNNAPVPGAPGRLILVTAINPTPAGEGKTTTSIGLADALKALGKKTCLALREPSLGPVFGLKGGAAGGGYAQVIPMEDINLHFTGDFHAIGAANNLLCAMTDNSLKQGNPLGLDPARIRVRRCVDMNDRSLRNVVIGLGGPADGVPRQEGYDITVASEVMAVFCLAKDLADLKERLGRIIVGYTPPAAGGKAVTAHDLKAEGAMTALLKDALMPNLVQTLEHTPALIHGGPFANIAHGCNSLIATKTALSLADYTVTEAGFGADLGAEKFLDIKCRMAGLWPDACVLVATVRALKYNGGVPKEELGREDTEALSRGLANLEKHIENLKGVYGLPLVAAINRFPTDSEAEFDLIRSRCEKLGVKAVVSEVFAKGSEGGKELAEEVIRLCGNGCPAVPAYAYELSDSIEEKIEKLALKIYGAKGVELSASAKKQAADLTARGFGECPVCMAKTQYSLSDDPKLLGAPKDFTLKVREIRISAGAGFIVALTGEIMTMPGLPKRPAAEGIDVDAEGRISGLF